MPVMRETIRKDDHIITVDYQEWFTGYYRLVVLKWDTRLGVELTQYDRTYQDYLEGLTQYHELVRRYQQ